MLYKTLYLCHYTFLNTIRRWQYVWHHDLLAYNRLIVTAKFPQVRYRFYSKRYSTILTYIDEETEDNDLATAGNYFSSKKDNKLNAWTKQNLDFCGDGNLGDGDSPVIVDVEEAVASIPADNLEQPPDSSPQASKYQQPQ